MDGEGYDIESFLAKPSPEYINIFRKNDWVKLVTHFNILLPDHPSKLRKSVLKDIVVTHLIKQGIMDAPDLPVSEDGAPFNLATNPPTQNNFEHSQPTQVEIEKLRVEMQFQLEREKIQLERGKLELEKEKWAVAKEQGKGNPLTEKISDIIAMIPTFDEGDIEGSLHVFERLATKKKWPKDEWMSLIAPKLTGKSLRTYINLDRPDDYEFVK